MRTDGADRVGDPWDDLLALRTSEGSSDVDEELEAALLSYKQRKAARWGAERFADELRRRDEAEEPRPVWTSDALSPPVDASVEAQVVAGEPVAFRPEPPRIGFDPRFVVEPAERIPDVVREPTSDEAPEPIELAVTVDPEPETEPVAPPVELSRFAPDTAWSAGSPAGKLERLPAALRNPHVPRPPAPEPAAPARRRWRGKGARPEPVSTTSVITDAEWARMSPGARRLYGFDEPPEERRAG